jgi:hypothetical protein
VKKSNHFEEAHARRLNMQNCSARNGDTKASRLQQFVTGMPWQHSDTNNPDYNVLYGWGQERQKQ